MNHRFGSVLLGTAALGLLLQVSAHAASSPSSAGIGAHGYDFLIGTWTCKNGMPSAMAGPATTTLTIASSVNGSLSFHVTGANFGAMGYVVYDAKTKTWWNPSTGATGWYGTESTQQTGRKSVWAGPLTDPTTGKTTPQRDTFTWVSPTTYTDLYQMEMNGTWKTEGKTTCTKS